MIMSSDLCLLHETDRIHVGLTANYACGHSMRQKISNFVISFTERSSVYTICGLDYIRPTPQFMSLKEARDCPKELVNVRCEIIDIMEVEGKDYNRNLKFQVCHRWRVVI